MASKKVAPGVKRNKAVQKIMKEESKARKTGNRSGVNKAVQKARKSGTKGRRPIR